MIDDTQRAEIFRLCREMYSAGMIARQLDLTRNQVMGVIHRAKAKGMDLPMSQTRSSNRPPVPHNPKPEKPREPKPIVPADEPEPIGPVGAFAVKGSCQFIRGDVTADFQMCGHPGHPWCGFHKALVYVPPNSRKRTEAHNG